jgi:hypothetical protein
MDKREVVENLDPHGCLHRMSRFAADGLTGQKKKNRPDSFSTAGQNKAQRLIQRSRLLLSDEPFEKMINQ